MSKALLNNDYFFVKLIIRKPECTVEQCHSFNNINNLRTSGNYIYFT